MTLTKTSATTMTNEVAPFLSARVSENIKDEFMKRLMRVLGNLYDPVDNPAGVVNLGVAENVSDVDVGAGMSIQFLD